MRGRTHEHRGAAHHPREHEKHGGHPHGHHHKAKGGGIMKAGGNPEVEREAEEKKHGGKVKRHGRHHRKHGGHVEGKHSKHRMDRAAGGRATRKHGGGVGSDHNPLSSAHHAGDNPGKQPKTQQGGLSPV